MNPAIHWGGAALIGGAVTMVLGIAMIATRPVVGQAIAPNAAALMLVSTALLLLALPAMYAVQAEATGTLALAGQWLLSTGLLLPVVVSALPLLHPSIDAPVGEHPLVFALGIALTVGLLMTSIATFQGGVLPRGAGALMLAATVGFFFVFFVAEFLPPAAGQVGSALFGILLAVALAWIGLDLWQRP